MKKSATEEEVVGDGQKAEGEETAQRKTPPPIPNPKPKPRRFNRPSHTHSTLISIPQRRRSPPFPIPPSRIPNLIPHFPLSTPQTLTPSLSATPRLLVPPLLLLLRFPMAQRLPHVQALLLPPPPPSHPLPRPLIPSHRPRLRSRRRSLPPSPRRPLRRHRPTLRYRAVGGLPRLLRPLQGGRRQPGIPLRAPHRFREGCGGFRLEFSPQLFRGFRAG